jgi:putative spermidine/putrescine transport system ATP-binding protein
MNLIEGTIAGGNFVHASFTVPVAVPEGPAVLAVRPEALDIVPASGQGMAMIHRVTDFGTHALVDIELPDRLRLKSTVPEARDWKAGQSIDLRPRAYAVYRDDKAIHRGAVGPAAALEASR